MPGQKLLSLLSLAFLLLCAPHPAPARNELPEITLQSTVTTPWTGDLDGMIERRIIRVLVPYSKTFYFVDQGAQYGLAYDLFQLFEKELNKKLGKRHIRVGLFFIPAARDEFIPLLLQGKGDIVVANLTVTPERRHEVDFTSPTRQDVSEVVVSAPGAPPLADVDDLSGKEVYVRPSSSFAESLAALNARFLTEGKAPAVLKPAPEELETEDILEMVNAGLVSYTVADDHVVRFWKQVLPDITLHENIALRTHAQTAWMIRKDSPELKKELDAFLSRYPKGSLTYNLLLKKYFQDTGFVVNATDRAELEKFDKVVELFRKYGRTYSVNHLLIMAQAYQESRLDQSARSPTGAVGIMQVLPSTAKDLHVGDVTKLENNIHAGVKYIRFMIDTFYADEPMDEEDKVLFAFASYNAGPGRVATLRKTAAQRGLDQNRWFNNVERIAAEKIGRETVRYVANIYKYYLAYKLVEEQRTERENVRQRILRGEKSR